MKEYPTEIIQPLGSHNPPSPCIKTEHVKEYLELPFSHLNPQQSEFLPYLEEDHINIVLAAPTSSGKTLCAELFAARGKKVGKRILYIAPMKALASEKYRDWTGKTFKNYKIEILTGDYELTDSRKKSLDEADIISLTPEMFNSKCRTYDSYNFLKNSWIIVDECHLVGMEGRGDSLEVGIVQYFEKDSQSRALFLSATIPNVGDFGKWLQHLSNRETKIINNSYRPCKLNVELVGFKDSDRGRNLFYAEKESQRMDKTLELVQRYNNDPVLVFVGSKDFGHKLSLQLKALKIDHYFHNADLDMEERSRIEEGFLRLDFKVLISSPTLAWGVNTPARYVIQTHTKFGMTNMHPANIWQSVGRAGRAGYSDRGDAFILVGESELNKEKRRIFEEYKVVSTLNDINLLMFHVLSYICNGGIKNANDLYDWYHKTLSSVQKNHITKEIAQKVLDNLVARSMIKKNEDETYEARRLGHICNMMYMSPIDVSDWFTNFSRIKRLTPSKEDTQPKRINLQVARALSEVYSYGITWVSKDEQGMNNNVYMSKREKFSRTVQNIAKVFGKQLEPPPHLKYTAIFYNLLSGEDVDSELYATYYGLQKDFERIIQTLQMADNYVGKFYKNSGKCSGFGWGKHWDILMLRLKYGLSHDQLSLIPLLDIKGVGIKTAKKLFENGIKSKEQLFSVRNRENIKKIIRTQDFNKIFS